VGRVATGAAGGVLHRNKEKVRWPSLSMINKPQKKGGGEKGYRGESFNCGKERAGGRRVSRKQVGCPTVEQVQTTRRALQGREGEGKIRLEIPRVSMDRRELIDQKEVFSDELYGDSGRGGKKCFLGKGGGGELK